MIDGTSGGIFFEHNAKCPDGGAYLKSPNH